MHTLSNWRMAAVILLTAMTVFGCEKQSESDVSSTETISTSMEAPDLPDTTGSAVWAYLSEVDYRNNWALFPGKEELYTGREPHGMLLTTYVNNEALGALTTHAGSMPNGAVVVKENYKPDSTLAAITVMYKVADYNSEHNDWFFSKHLPDGSLATTPDGMALEGRVPGCQTCHSEQKSNDYIFTGSLSE